MIVRHARRLVLVGLVAATLAPADPAVSGERAVRVQDWLTDISASMAAAGYRLSWGEVSTSQFGGDVTVRELRGSDPTGTERLRIAALTVVELENGPDSILTAVGLEVDEVVVSGPFAYTIDRIEIARPDLDVVAESLQRYVVQAPSTDRSPRSRRLAVERVEIRGLKGLFTSADGPLDIRFDRFLAVGADTGRIRHLEIDGARQSATGPDGALVTTSMAELRVDDLTIAPAVYDMAEDTDTMRPFSALAGIDVGRFEIKDLRAESSLTGTSTVDRTWIRTRSSRPGRAGVISFGNEGMRSQTGEAPNPFTPFMQVLFPPDGEVPMQLTGDVAYDVDNGFIGFRQEMAVDAFGSFNLQVDLVGMPDLSIAEWRTVGKGDPRLQALQVNGVSLSLTDAGGLDRAVTVLAADKSIPANRLRGAVAEQIGAIVTGMDPKTDPRLLRWLTVVQDFVRLGGTLALGVTKPIPIGDVRGQSVKIRDLSDLAERYGLAVVRR